MSEIVILSDRGEGKNAFRAFAASGELKEDNFDERFILWNNLYIGLLKSVFVTEELSPEEANVAFGIGLSVWGVSEARAKKIVSRPLGLAAIQ